MGNDNSNVDGEKPSKKKSSKSGEESKGGEKLDKLDKVYNEMKQKNKKVKKELADSKKENENLRSIFAEFQVEFKQNKKHEKLFQHLTVSDLDDIFAIQ